jgi:YVTN family beta-propeller protein
MRRQFLPYLLAPLLTMAISTHPTAQAPSPGGTLVVANQGDHTLLLLDLATQKQIASVEVGVNGHEVVISADEKFAYVPIYGNSGVGKPGTDGRTIDVVDLRAHSLAGTIDLGKPVRPHCARFAPDDILYVSAELSNALYAIDPETRKVVAEIPTGAEQSHMFVISPRGDRAYTANVSSGTVSVLDLKKRTLLTIIPVAKTVQRISISPDGRYVFTHDQNTPRIAVIDTATNKIARWIDVPSTIYSSDVTPDNQHLITASPSGKVFIIDIAQSKILTTIDVPPSTGELIVSPDGAQAYLSCPQAAHIQVLDLHAGKLLEDFPLTKGVDGLAIVAPGPAYNF